MAGVRSEDELGVKWDRCLADTGIKLLAGDVITDGDHGYSDDDLDDHVESGGACFDDVDQNIISPIHQYILSYLGLTVGSVFSLVLFKRRMWPITFGMGMFYYGNDPLFSTLLLIDFSPSILTQVLGLEWATTTVKET